MPKGIDEFVSENRQSTNRIDATFIQVSGQQRQNLNFLNSFILVPTSIKVYTRPLNNSLISGHPDGSSHGSGYGEAGDVRGGWTLVEDVEETENFTQSGRNAVRNVLAGETSAAIDSTAVGAGTTPADPDDTSLQSESGRANAWGREGASVNETISQSFFLFNQFGDSVSEFGVYSGNGNLLNRVTTSAVNPGASEELRVDVSFTIQGSGLGDSVITDDGKASIAESLRRKDTQIGIQEFVYGSGSSDPSPSDSSLESPEFTKIAATEKDPQILIAQTILTEAEPKNQPVNISEIGVKDNNGRLIWRAAIEQFEKTTEFGFDTAAGFRIK